MLRESVSIACGWSPVGRYASEVLNGGIRQAYRRLRAEHDRREDERGGGDAAGDTEEDDARADVLDREARGEEARGSGGRVEGDDRGHRLRPQARRHARGQGA